VLDDHFTWVDESEAYVEGLNSAAIDPGDYEDITMDVPGSDLSEGVKDAAVTCWLKQDDTSAGVDEVKVDDAIEVVVRSVEMGTPSFEEV